METAEEFLETGRQANARIARIDRELELLEKRQDIEIPDGLSMVELDAQLLAAERDLAAARSEARELDAQVGARTERRRRLPELLALARQRLADLDEAPPAEADDPSLQPLLADIERLRREALQAEIDAYGAELSSYDVRGTLLSKQRDRARFGSPITKSLPVACAKRSGDSNVSRSKRRPSPPLDCSMR
jgi:hypothetical protein